MEKLYTAEVTATGGRDGHIKSSDGILDFDLENQKNWADKAAQPTPKNYLRQRGSLLFRCARIGRRARRC
jgi:hypothetical protein